MKKYLIIILLCFALPVLAQDNEKLRVAIFDPSTSGSGVDHTTAVAVRELISSTVVNSGKYEIVERSLLDKIMKEQQFSQSGAVDESQITEIGKMAGANKVVVSVLSAVGNRIMISIKLIDVTTASIELQKARTVNADDLLDCIEPLTMEVFNISNVQVVPTTPVQTSSSTNSFFSRFRRTTPTPQAQAQTNTQTNSTSTYNAPSRNTASNGDFIPSPERMLRNQGLNEGNLRELAYQPSVYVRCDFSPARVNGMDLITFGNTLNPRLSEKYQYLPFGKAMKTLEGDICRIFCEGANNKTKFLRYQNVQENAYTLTIYLVGVDKAGRLNICDYVFSETATGRVVAVITRVTIGGVIGSFTDLLTDAFKVDSEEFAQKMNKLLWKAQKGR